MKKSLMGILSVTLLAFPLAVSASSDAMAVLTKESYVRPPADIEQLVLAPRHLNVALRSVSPDGGKFLITLGGGMPPLANLSKPYYNLGGLQLDPGAFRARSLTIRDSAGFEVFDWRSRGRMKIQTPAGFGVSSPSWSPDGSQIAYLVHADDASHIWIANVGNGRSRQLTRTPLNAVLGASFSWTADGRNIVAVLRPNPLRPEPSRDAVPQEPMVRVTSDRPIRQRTHPSLLQTPHDQALLEHYATGQLVIIDARSGATRSVGAPKMIRSVDVAPDGLHFRVTTMEKPFSYIVPTSSFGTREELWDSDGKVLAEISSRPLRDGTQGGEDPYPSSFLEAYSSGWLTPGMADLLFEEQRPARPTGDDQQTEQRPGRTERRGLNWRPDGKGMSFLQLEPSQRGRQDSERKDRVVQWLPPYGEDDVEIIYESETRLASVRYSEDCKILFLTESAGGTEKVYAVYLDNPEEKHTIYEHRTENFYENPGSLMTTRGSLGESVIRMSTDGSYVYLSGTRYFENPLENAPRPFIDKVEIKTGEKERVFESAETTYDQVLAVLDNDLRRIVISRESRTIVPDSHLLDTSTGQTTNLTHNRDYAPEITNARRERVQVTRVDGFKFWVNVTLPSDWQEGDKLPAMFWFYPREFTNQAAYDRGSRTLNINSFPNWGARSMVLLTQLGYAFVEPDCPIVGPQGRMNDRYVPDLRNNLSAVIDELDGRGMIDRRRLAIGGHSYGGFSTANAMIHTPFFKAGIAGAGNYNRMLTPSGFQTESRDLWDARETYLTMSPLLYVEQLNGAILLYHGMDDQNVGTFPINSERMFHALSSLGKSAALYMYPYEGHGQIAEETTLDMWGRWSAWLDKYVKNGLQSSDDQISLEIALP